MGTQTGFLYDGDNAVQELSGTTVISNSLTAAGGEVIQRTDSSGARNFMTDYLGSTLSLTDSSGAVQTSYTYDPFGNASVGGSATTNSVTYVGREFDNPGLYFDRARYYSSTIQRFISEDPSGFGGGDVNLYTYAANDPVNHKDSNGQWSTVAHDMLLDSGLNGLASQPDIDAIKLASQAFDARTQGPEFANLHAMAKPGQSAQEAIDATNQWVDTMMAMAHEQELLGNHAVALDLFAQGAHPMMDSSSFIHRDQFTGDPFTWGCGWDCRGNWIEHSLFDFQGFETSADLTSIREIWPDIARKQDQSLADAYRKVFGGTDLGGRKN
jgi:RHS repeat-associated protein